MAAPNPFAFGPDISLGDFENLLSSAPDRPLTLWSLQQPGAVECLKATRRLTGDPKFAFAPERTGKVEAGKKEAYSWMQKQMEKRLPFYRQELPVWALLSRPKDSTRQEDQLLRIEVPKHRTLISFYQPWKKLLEIMVCLEGSGGRWPEQWLFSCPYLSTDSSQQDREFLNHPGLSPRPRRVDWNEQECRQSWETMFQLTLARRAGFLWLPICLQAMLPSILLSEVREVLPIPLRTS